MNICVVALDKSPHLFSLRIFFRGKSEENKSKGEKGAHNEKREVFPTTRVIGYEGERTLM